MNALLVRDAAEKLGVQIERVFGLSFEWAEEPRPKKFITKVWLDWFHTGKIHPIVQDFVIDVLAGRIVIPKLLKNHEPPTKK